MIGLLGVVVVAAVLLGSVRSTMVSTESPAVVTSGSATAIPFDPESPRVRGGSQSSGWALFGLQFGGSTTLSIDFPVSRSCFDNVAVGEDWPTDDTACEPDPQIDGTVTQRDDTPSLGPRLVVETPVSKGCYTVAAGGVAWPTGLPECAAEESGAASR